MQFIAHFIQEYSRIKTAVTGGRLHITENHSAGAAAFPLIFFHSITSRIPQMVAATVSEMGPAIHTPFSLKMGGRISNIGMSTMTWRRSVRKTAVDAFPMD